MKKDNNLQNKQGLSYSDQELLNPNSEAQYDSKRWIKCEFNNRTKRFFDPPKSLPDLISIFQKRFRDLDDQLQQVQREMQQKEQDLLQSINLAYIDSDGEENGIDEQINLLDAYKYAEVRDSKKVLKMVVRVRQKARERKISQIQQYQLQQVEQYQEKVKDEVYGLQQLNEEPKQAPGELQEIVVIQQHNLGNNQQLGDQNIQQEQAKVVELDEQPLFQVPNEELQEQQKLLQHFEEEKAKKQEQEDEKFARELEIHDQFILGQNQQKPLPQSHNNQQYDVKWNDEVYHFKPADQMNQSQLNQSVNRPQNIFKKLAPIVTIDCKKVKDIKQMGQQINAKKIGIFKKWINQFLADEKNNANSNQSMAVALNGQECYARGMPGQMVYLHWQVKNDSKLQWDKQNKLRNYQAEDAHIRDLPVSIRLKPSKMMLIHVNLKLPSELGGKDKIILQFRFVNSKEENFGDSLIGIIDLSPNLDESSAFYDQYQGQFSHNNQSSLLNQSLVMDNEVLYNEASNLSDKGYGTFDRCFQILTACKGNIVEAEKILSKLMIKENK